MDSTATTLVVAVCVSLIYLVERLIIATPGVLVVAFIRLLIAVGVAFLGATAVDLVLFNSEVVETIRKADTEVRKAEEKALSAKQAAEDEVLRKEAVWQKLLADAICEADGTCGSRLPNPGRRYEIKKEHAERAKQDWLKAKAELATVMREGNEAVRLAKHVASERAESAGLLERFEALEAFLEEHPRADLIYKILMALLVLFELLVLVVKMGYAKTVDDQIQELGEALSLWHVKQHFQAVHSPTYRASLLLEKSFGP